MEHSPPPFFKTGPTPLARLLIFTTLSLALLVADVRFKYLEFLRQIAAVIVYPAQRLAAAPGEIARRAGDFFVTHSALREDNARLHQEQLANTLVLQQFKALQAENEQMRALLGARERIGTRATLAEVLYSARDPFAQKIIVDRGLHHEVRGGQPVIDQIGVVGQVTRAYQWLSEVTLITDKDQLVPVLNVRNGLRAVLAGVGTATTLELRFVPLNADFQNGDRLVTSGIDGVYPPGLPVAEISNVERDASYPFARIACKPLAGVNRSTQVLIVNVERNVPDRPAEQEERPARGKRARRAGS
ncbi:MAG: rod shape-determining protein MreC [Betaproteobacteria bacterium]